MHMHAVHTSTSTWSTRTGMHSIYASSCTHPCMGGIDPFSSTPFRFLPPARHRAHSSGSLLLYFVLTVGPPPHSRRIEASATRRNDISAGPSWSSPTCCGERSLIDDAETRPDALAQRHTGVELRYASVRCLAASCRHPDILHHNKNNRGQHAKIMRCRASERGNRSFEHTMLHPLRLIL